MLIYQRVNPGHSNPIQSPPHPWLSGETQWLHRKTVASPKETKKHHHLSTQTVLNGYISNFRWSALPCSWTFKGDARDMIMIEYMCIVVPTCYKLKGASGEIFCAAAIFKSRTLPKLPCHVLSTALVIIAEEVVWSPSISTNSDYLWFLCSSGLLLGITWHHPYHLYHLILSLGFFKKWSPKKNWRDFMAYHGLPSYPS